MTDDRIVDKIAKLLRQAEDVTGTPEEEAFQERAFALLAKHGIDLATVRAHQRGLDISDIPNAIDTLLLVRGPYQAEQKHMLSILAEALHCKTVGLNNMPLVHVFGMSHHVERLRMLWEILQPQATRLVAKVEMPKRETFRTATVDEWAAMNRAERLDHLVQMTRDKRAPQSLHVYRQSWLIGFAASIAERIKQQEGDAANKAGVVALYKSDRERARDAMRDAYPDAVNTMVDQFSDDGFKQGARAGLTAAMDRPIDSVDPLGLPR
ncbi:DUF2786 domain-containing protein [Mycobacteroides abscessus]|uniref:DUF2786 domain-containing protein n=1 Tax=Mycobacteroides abscessus TaxID=36809 RepID=UPI0009269213|nr:DUF2786 domain-containing protein [Mycobacteroides abscessus]DAZ90273.1 TPA_asm: hypothetical protein PROPHIFSIL01-1_86 [Mycobacterium phage prophiFSIL01-1]SHZ93438.1 Protein of uncharacterised function (DUF2786) [Mycobacteroides abscessus subsp. abscessus]SIA06439.1 Protein of uncharacterised function (DUF2786) [Mycobacteroides abscessus subsp. abscessus]SIA64456.1 Protein of uncharacterised function (DUF2786) [Mycobacteroides abscessus subsp. abscessus]SIA69435.1 Protein of uncharacterise